MDRERLALTTQVGVLAQEVSLICSPLTVPLGLISRASSRQVRFGKRLTIAQLVGILALVVFVGFTRGLPTSPFLHLASTRGEGRSIGWRRARSDRGSSVDDSPKPEEAAVLPPASGMSKQRALVKAPALTSCTRSPPQDAPDVTFDVFVARRRKQYEAQAVAVQTRSEATLRCHLCLFRRRKERLTARTRPEQGFCGWV